jgi:hypothetical protein
MQREVDTLATVRPIRIFGLNEAGQESGNAAICAGPPPRSLPWLQDTQQAKVWTSWQVTYRDVIIVDGENKVIRAYNLTDHDLANGATYAELRDILLAAAR